MNWTRYRTKLGSLPIAQVQLDLAAGPRRDASPKEILVFGPNRRIQQQSSRNYGPIVRIARSDSRSRALFELLVETVLDDIEAALQKLAQVGFAHIRIEPLSLRYWRNIFERFLDTYLWRVENDCLNV